MNPCLVGFCFSYFFETRFSIFQPFSPEFQRRSGRTMVEICEPWINIRWCPRCHHMADHMIKEEFWDTDAAMYEVPCILIIYIILYIIHTHICICIYIYNVIIYIYIIHVFIYNTIYMCKSKYHTVYLCGVSMLFCGLGVSCEYTHPSRTMLVRWRILRAVCNVNIA